MNRRHLCTLVAVFTLGLSWSAWAAGNSGGNHSGGSGNGNNSSPGAGHSGNPGNADAGAPPAADTKGQANQAGKSTKTGKTVAQQLTEHKRLTTQLGQLLPAGTDLQAAAAGFKNLGQFVAAVHVSKNLSIPFSDLKTRLMDGASLGTAIKALRPDVNATTEANKAQRQARQDLAGGR